MGKDCPKPKDWSRVKCNNCGNMGHTVKRCPEPAMEQANDYGSGGGGGGWGNDTAQASGDWANAESVTAKGDWADAVAGESNGAGGWGNDLAGASGDW